MSGPLTGPRARIALPADFAQHLDDTNVRLAARYGVNPRTIAKMRKRHGFPPAERFQPAKDRQRALPDDFQSTAATMGLNALVRHYSTGQQTVRRWLAEVGVVRARPDYSIPEWWASDAPRMSLSAACERAAVSHETVRKWEKASGVRCLRSRSGRPKSPPKVKPARVVAIKPPRPPRAPKPKPEPIARRAPEPRRHYRAKATRQPINPVQRDMSNAGRAADFLRRWCAVYRCNDVGAQSQGGKFWRYGNAVVTDRDLIERAERKGWQSDAWAQVAA